MPNHRDPWDIHMWEIPSEKHIKVHGDVSNVDIVFVSSMRDRV